MFVSIAIKVDLSGAGFHCDTKKCTKHDLSFCKNKSAKLISCFEKFLPFNALRKTLA